MSQFSATSSVFTRQEAWTQSTPLKEFSSNSFFKEVKPILMILRVLGRFPYKITNDGIAPFSVTSLSAIYCFVFQAGSCYFSFITMQTLIHESFWNSKTYNDKLLIIILISYLSNNLLVPITFWLSAPRIKKYIERWSRFESEFKKEFAPLRYPRNVKYLCILSVPSAMIHILYVIWMFIENRARMVFVFYQVTITAYLSMILWFVSLREIRLQVEALRRNILNEERLTELDEKRRFWATISHLTAETGHCFGAACGTLSLSAFVSYLISIYGFFSTLISFKEGTKVEWQLLIPLVFYSIYFFSMSERGEKTSTEVGPEFISFILKIRDSQQYLTDNNEMSLFLLTMQVGQPKLTFTGFAVVNRGLVRSLVMHTLTFLLVLIQFKS